MFAGFMMNAWTTATIVAVVAGVVGYFVVLRGSAFPAHAIPKGAFAGAAGASLLGISTLLGLAVFSVLGALGIGFMSRRGRRDVVTALALVMMLALGAAFLSRTTEYEPEIFSLLFGEVLGVSTSQILPVAALGLACIAAVAVIYRPLMLSSIVPEIAEARGIRGHRIEICFLLVVALATAMTVPVVGALLIFSLMIGPPAAARSFTSRPLPGHVLVGRHRPGHRVGRDRRVLPVQLAHRLLRRCPRRAVLRRRPRLGRLAPHPDHPPRRPDGHLRSLKQAPRPASRPLTSLSGVPDRPRQAGSGAMPGLPADRRLRAAWAAHDRSQAGKSPPGI